MTAALGGQVCNLRAHLQLRLGQSSDSEHDPKGLQKELDQISQLEDYSDLLCWDFILTKAATISPDMYGLRPVPRKKDTQKAIDAAWSAATTVTTLADFYWRASPQARLMVLFPGNFVAADFVPL